MKLTAEIHANMPEALDTNNSIFENRMMVYIRLLQSVLPRKCRKQSTEYTVRRHRRRVMMQLFVL